MAFLEFLIETAKSACGNRSRPSPATAPADAFAEPKRLQDELQEEIPPLKEKIKTELTPQPAGGGSAPQAQLERAGARDRAAAGLGRAPPVTRCRPPRASSTSRQAEPAAADQQAAIDELEKIWDAVIPFHPLLARDLADQTTDRRRSLAPPPPPIRRPGPASPPAKRIRNETQTKPARKADRAGTGHAALGTESEDLAPLTEVQERTLRRTQLLKLKAEAELTRLEKAPPPMRPEGPRPTPGKDDPKDAGTPRPKPVDPKQIKAGYQKAIELAPQAVEQMERAVKSLKQKDRQAAYPPAEEARKILEEIQKAQPKQDQQDQKQQDKKEERGPAEAGSEQEKQGTAEAGQKDKQKKDREKQEQAERRSRNRRSRKSQASPTSRRQDQKAAAAAAGLARSDRRGPAQGAANGSRKSASETAR